jgi:hypothetical protein
MNNLVGFIAQLQAEVDLMKEALAKSKKMRVAMQHNIKVRPTMRFPRHKVLLEAGKTMVGDEIVMGTDSLSFGKCCYPVLFFFRVTYIGVRQWS